MNISTSVMTIEIASDVNDHLISMATAGYPVTGDHLLWPEGPDFPGSYQIWLKIAHQDASRTGWIYVDPDGVVHHRDYPGADVKVPTDG